MRPALYFLILILPVSLYGQFEFQLKTDIPVTINGQNLSRAWEGGLNAAQFQTMDLNNDNRLDLVIYNRISRDISTYLNINNQYIWSPEFAYQFPEDVVHWVILKDYDCDGLKDLFTSTALGIKVYRNTSTGSTLSWEEAAPFLRFDSGTNIQVSPNDIPGIADINGDGALDILTYRFGTASTVDYFENTGTCGSLSFTRAERQWGGFEECDCDSFVFGGAPCPGGNSIGSFVAEINAPNLIQHAGGKTILPFDADNDGDIDILSSDEFCQTLYFLENVGDNSNAVMSSLVSYPVNNPAAFNIFPSAFLEDVNFDGLQDLIISTNADENIGNQIDLRSNIKAHLNTGSSTIPDFDQPSIAFFQNQMLDLGEQVYPTVFDLEGDGDLDIIVGNKGNPDNGVFSSSLFNFENNGNVFNPSFLRAGNDVFNLKSLNSTFLKPQGIDADGDGDIDLFYQATLGANDTRIFFREALSTGNYATPVEINIDTEFDENPFFYDIDNDGDLDLLLGNRLGSLSLFVNNGNFNFGAEVTNFGGITNDFQNLNLWPHVVDLNSDGQDELITISSSGRINIYEAPINENFNAQNPISAILKINDEIFASQFGRQNSIASGDFFNTGKPALLIGSSKGGFYFLENLSEGGSSPGGAIQIALSPNPTNNEITVLTDTDGKAEVYNLLGQKIYFNIEVQRGVSKKLRLGSLPIGVYILRVTNDQNQSATRKILVYK